MNKICCVGDADICPKSSSCSMVLRSACSHRHSRESSTVKEHLHSSPSRKSKSVATVSNGSLQLESSLQSSLKQLALKSAESTYSILKGQFYDSFEISKSASQNVFEVNSLNVSCAKELHFSHLSDSNSSSIYKSLRHKECNSDYSSATESDINASDSLVPTSNMSNSQRFTRNSLRSLSGSEDEDDITVDQISRPTRSLSSGPNLRSRRNIFSNEANNLYLSNNNASFLEEHHDTNSHLNRPTGHSDGDSLLTQSTEPSHLDSSSVQYSMLDRFRWFLWRCTYLKIIKSINFDVWLLSRINNYGKLKVVLSLLLTLLVFLVWGVLRHNSHSLEPVYETLSSVISSFLSFVSSIFSSLYKVFVKEEEVDAVSDLSDTTDGSCLSDSTFFKSLFSLFTVISGWFASIRESASSTSESKYHPTESLYHQNEEINSFPPSGEEINSFQSSREGINSFQSSREEIRLLALEVTREEIKLLREYLKFSAQETELDKIKKEQKLQSDIRNLHFEFQSLSGTVGKLEKDLMKLKEKSETNENIIALTSEYKSHIDHLNVKLKTIEAKLDLLERLKSSCDKQLSQEDFLALLEKHLVFAFKSVIDGDTEPNSKYYFFSEWLNSKFFSHEKLMREINAALRRQSSLSSDNKMNFDNVIKVVESTVLEHVNSLKRNLSELSRSSYPSFSQDIFSEDRVKKIVKEAIMLYDADKTGQVDYALESGGGSVLGTRCSETYVEKYGKLSIFGVPLWTNSNSPRTAIQPDVQPGRCWAFKGSQGFLVLELSATIYPTGFTLEHIPVSLSPSGSIDSAPKNFSVWGLDSEKDNNGNLLGEYWYDINGEPLQYFAVQKPSEKPYSHIELQVHSNHGNMEYTCLYRFRVHGQRVR